MNFKLIRYNPFWKSSCTVRVFTKKDTLLITLFCCGEKRNFIDQCCSISCQDLISWSSPLAATRWYLSFFSFFSLLVIFLSFSFVLLLPRQYVCFSSFPSLQTIHTPFTLWLFMSLSISFVRL